MRNMQNYVQLTGRLFDLPPPKRVSDGSYLINLRLSTGFGFSPAGTGGEQVYHLVAWNQLAIELSKRFRRGSRIMVAGELHNRLLRKEGVPYYRTEIIVKEFQALRDSQRDGTDIERSMQQNNDQ